MSPKVSTKSHPLGMSMKSRPFWKIVSTRCHCPRNVSIPFEPLLGRYLFYTYLLLNPKYTWRMKYFSKYIFDYIFYILVVQICSKCMYHSLFPDDMQYLSFKRLREFGRKCSDYLLINKIFCLSAWWLKISQLFVYYFSNTSFLSCSWSRIPTTFWTLSSLD